MKIKLNKEQVSYLNSLTDKEAKKDFLFDCFIEACEADLKNTQLLETVVFNDGVFETSKPRLINSLNIWAESSTIPLFYTNENTSSKHKSLSKEQLKNITKPIGLDELNFTNPYIVGWGITRERSEEDFLKEVDRAKKYFSSNILKEFVEYQPPHPDKVKKYSKEDLIAFYSKSRIRDFQGKFKYKNFDDVFKRFEDFNNKKGDSD